MKSTNERVYDILEKAKRLKVKKRLTKIASIVLSIVTVVTACNMILFLPYPEQRNNLKQYKNSEYYSIIQTVDSFATPWPSEMPGYKDKVIMAAGAFVQGSSIELSADGPIRPPYAVYFQGGLTWLHAKLGILNSLQKMVDAGLVTL